jgi:hypothetical protein
MDPADKARELDDSRQIDEMWEDHIEDIKYLDWDYDDDDEYQAYLNQREDEYMDELYERGAE